MMTKKDLVNYVVENTSEKIEGRVLKKDVAVYVDAVIDGIVDALKKDGKLQLTGFGTFEAKQVPEREARNPKTGEKVKVDAHKKPSFKPGKGLKDCLN